MDQAKLIDQSKLKREIESYRKSLNVDAHLYYETTDIEGLYLDGKNDNTLAFEEDDQGKLKKVFYVE